MVVAICAKFVQPDPVQRQTWYPVTPTLSVEAPQLRLIWLVPAAVAYRLLGAVGGVVSEGAVTVTWACAVQLLPLPLPPASSVTVTVPVLVPALPYVTLTLDPMAVEGVPPGKDQS